MPFVKCPKCGKTYEEEHGTFHSPHICEKKLEEKRIRAKQKWDSASGIGKIFLYHPDVSLLVRFVAFTWLFLSVGVLPGIVLLVGEVILGGKTNNLATYIYMMTVGSASFFLSYGISHLKRWSLYLYGVLLLFIFVMTGYIMLGFMGIFGLLVVLLDHKKFH